MSKYEVIPSQNGSASDTIKGSAAIYRKLSVDFKTQVTELGTYWKGPDYESFKNQMETVILELEKMAEKLEYDAQIMDAQAGNYTNRVQGSIDTLPK